MTKAKMWACSLATPLQDSRGLNRNQSAEMVFAKLADALAGPFDDILIHPNAQSHLDYEGELAVVISNDSKNVFADQALNYVLRYTVGNDVSARNYQLPEVSGGQFCYAKSFDCFAPIGPCITKTHAIKDPRDLKYPTKLHGQLRQQTGTNDMIWVIRQIIEHLSQGSYYFEARDYYYDRHSQRCGFFHEAK